MWTLAAFTASIATGSPLLQVNAAADQHLNIYSNSLAVPEEVPNIFAMAAMAANLTRAQFQSPSLRRIFLEELNPLIVSAIATSPQQLFYLEDDVLPLLPNELLQFFAAQNAVGAQQVTGFIWLCDTPPARISAQDVHTLRISASGTAVANAWTNMTITFDQTLPVGRYQLVGARMRSANMMAYRFVVRGYPWRPGLLGQVNVGDVLLPANFRRGQLGVWCEFTNLVQPTLDVMCNAGDSSFTGEIDVIYLG